MKIGEAKMFMEVENFPVGTVSGLVYKIDPDGTLYFLDENQVAYKMHCSNLRPCNYYEDFDKEEIIEDMKFLKLI